MRMCVCNCMCSGMHNVAYHMCSCVHACVFVVLRQIMIFTHVCVYIYIYILYIYVPGLRVRGPAPPPPPVVYNKYQGFLVF